MQFDHILDLDFETWSPTDIKSAGAAKYAEKAEILLMSYSIDEGPVIDVDVYHHGFPEDIKAKLTDPRYLKRSHNAPFEKWIIFWCLGIYCPPEQWECLQVKAAMAGLPMSLDGSTSALGLSEDGKKDWTGSALIRYFCIPCKPTKANGFRTRNLPEHDPEKWQKFIGYCHQDVVAQIAEARALSWFDIPALERRLWCLDQRCNERGIRVDMQLVNNAIELDTTFRESLLAEAVELTGLRNANSVAQLKKWLSEEMGEEVKSLSKNTVTKLMAKTEEVNTRRVLEIRSMLAKSSIKKYQAMINATSTDGRIRGTLQFYGAGRTGRDAGRGIQIQNLPRITLSEEMLAMARELVLAKDVEMLDICFGNMADTLSQLIRTALVPAKGNKFFVSDFRSVEAVVLAWLAGEQKVLDLFNKHPKIYEATASIMFNVPIESIVKGSTMYQQGKVSNLAMGFQGAFNAVVNMMDSLGMVGESRIPDKEIPGMVTKFRESHPNIVNLWYDLDRSAKTTIKTGQTTFVGKHLKFVFKNKNLLMYLPSGRFLCYHGAHVREVWNLKGKILGYTSQTCKFKQFVITDNLISWAKKSLEGKEEQLKNIEEDKHKDLWDGEDYWIPNKMYGKIFLGEVWAISEIQRRELLLFWAIDQTNKQWSLSSTYGGKLAENATQATARDCLMNGVINLEEEGYEVVMRVHDESVSDNEEGDIDEVNALMTKPAPWMKGLPLKAAGFAGDYYQK